MDAQRELVFCHECEEEWYRNEHGLSCPHCGSDFCEVIEQNHDPRNEFYNQDEEDDFDPRNIPDPDEDDIGHFAMPPNMTSTFEINGRPVGDTTTTYDGPRNSNARGAAPDDPQQTPLLNNFTTMLSGIMGITSQPIQRQTWQTPAGGQGQMRTTTYQFGNGRLTFTSSTGSTSGGFGYPPEGTRGGGAAVPGPNGDEFGQSMAGLLRALLGPGMEGTNHDHPGGMHRAFPVGPFGLFNPIFNGTHGDGVYTQEAFDRILTQLMDQNQTGNAPGPAPANEIAALPKRKIDSSMLGENGKAECTICMEEVTIGDEVTMLYCNHWFHEDCIGAWLSSHDTCPHCRMSLRESQEKAANAAGTGSGGNDSSTSKRDLRPGFPSSSRRSSTMSFRRRSSTTTTAGSPSSRAGPSNRDSGQGQGQNDNNSSPGLLDRARNLFRS